MAPVAKRGPKRFALIRRLWNENEWLYVAVGIMIGLMLRPVLDLFRGSFDNLMQNLAPEAVSTVFTVLILDRLGQMREEQQVREQLVRQMQSRYVHTALQAVEELRVLGHLADGTLVGRNLRGANLLDANLYEADLRDADLTNAVLEKADLVYTNLEGAAVTDKQLAGTDIMYGATMPDGKHYDGRYNLHGDFAYARRKGVDIHSPEEMAAWYGVSVSEYIAGQRWAKANLASLRGE